MFYIFMEVSPCVTNKRLDILTKEETNFLYKKHL